MKEKLESIKLRSEELEVELSKPEITKDTDRLQALSRELARLRPIVEIYTKVQRAEKEIEDLKSLIDDPETEADMKQLSEDELSELGEEKKELEYQLEEKLLEQSDPDADKDTIMEVRAGTGGEEAALFAADLYRMYSKYCVQKSFKINLLSASETGKGGFKEVIFEITGAGAFQVFKFESGIHRVQRVPETEASGRIHTSAVTVAVLPEVSAVEIKIDAKDLRIDVYRSSGPGGQSVNTTDSAVRITHIPSGVVVSCQDEKSQHKNKDKALKILRARVYEIEREKQHEEMSSQRKSMVGSGDRSGKIRTYNFPDNRLTDHRIGLTLHSLDAILEGHLDDVIQALAKEDRAKRLSEGLSAKEE